ncbi:Ltp family lipoprotein [Tessaracoccus oleiagri]|uniref:Host cell surface-exposed lipoprotein n=1 Tax=Tessaracoccus oleiagri TaxID=686624 RepID=A0A1G9I012_9ACTN|nr:Ltp family lipoprotein [Tessaracoccus oleiagri]SDL18386.1 Host cell surface-exposed lipoprotein [Tessaracoccus oleiagri]
MTKWGLSFLTAFLLLVGALFSSPAALADDTVVAVTAATAGTKDVGAATNVWGTVSGAPDSRVTVQALVNGNWSTSQIGKADATGFYALPLTYGSHVPGTYSYRVVAETWAGYVVSPTVTLTRVQNVKVSASTAGSKPVGAATNVWGTVTGAPNRPVTVQALVNGNWSNSRIGTTNASGFYALPLTYGMNTPGKYSFRVVVTTTAGYVVSPTVTLTRTQSVTVTASTAGSKEVGLSTNIWGTATGAPNRTVTVQAWVNGQWSNSRIGMTSSTGFYALPLTYGMYTPGTYSFRAVVSTGTGYAVSPTVTLTRTQKSVSQAQAMRAAQEYLDFMPFSRAGLIDQLEYEGFTTADATYAVDHIGADWNAQALREAKSYLEIFYFSEAGLIDQLLYDGYTEAQATYGVRNSGANWWEEAAGQAASYLEYDSFTRAEMIDQLLYDGFTADQAAYGATSVGLT